MSAPAAALAEIEVVRDPQKAAALFQPARSAVLEHLVDPDSASGVARKMGLPRQQVNYHLRELEKAGLLQFVEERRRGNCNERVVRATARSYLISPDALGRLGATPEERRDRFSAAYLVAAAARAIRDLAVLAIRAARAKKRFATLTLETEIRFRSAEERNQFAEELGNTVARLAARYHDDHAPGGRAFRVLAACYPVITKTSEDDGSDASLE
jgi:DNA-binding transcriptional ArsR family regulator